MFATCAYHCAECTTRQLEESEFCSCLCDGGFDVRDFSYHAPCSSCYERKYPAAQDWQESELDELLKPLSPPNSCITDLLADVKRRYDWSNIQLHPKEERIVYHNNQPIRMKYFKPFGKERQPYIAPDEMDDFKEFLDLIF